MKSLAPKKLIHLLESHGFIFQRSIGSHQLFRYPDGRHKIVPFYSKDLKTGTMLAILKQAGLSKDDI
jgi:predicted RNA binding protein YcfA (HicA-like mRNA interferase family)